MRFRDVVAVLTLRHVEPLKAEVATRRREVQTKTKKLAEEKAEMLLWWDHPGGRRDPEGGPEDRLPRLRFHTRHLELRYQVRAWAELNLHPEPLLSANVSSGVRIGWADYLLS